MHGALPVRSVQKCNLLEEMLEGSPSLEWKEGGVDFEARPFEIITLKLSLS